MAWGAAGGMRPAPAPRSGQGGYYRFCMAALLLLGCVALLQSPLGARVHWGARRGLQGAASQGSSAAEGAGAARNGSASVRNVLVEFSVAGAQSALPWRTASLAALLASFVRLQRPHMLPPLATVPALESMILLQSLHTPPPLAHAGAPCLLSSTLKVCWGWQLASILHEVRFGTRQLRLRAERQAAWVSCYA